MSFDTPQYLIFLASSVLLHRHLPQKYRYLLLLCLSLTFYACWSLYHLGLILFVILGTYLSALGINRCQTKGARRACLALGIAVCLGLLGYFKYFNFLMRTFSLLWGGRWQEADILLPVGCSFYTFQALSYTVDVYRGRARAEKNILHYALFVSFFPQLVAGPIERVSSLMPQLKDGKTASDEDVRRGVFLVMTGLFRKIVVADLAGPMVDRVFALQSPDGFAVTAATVLFALQIYCDFAGYSDIARGSALMMGVSLRENFRQPYLAGTVRDFWRRWHISLSQWFTDYVYIPLGGSRHGMKRQALAAMAVFLLSGLWHGADWSFVLWGFCHGILCVGEMILDHGRGGHGPLRHLATLVMITALWLLFRAESISQALMMARCVFSPWNIADGVAQLGLTLSSGLCLGMGAAVLPLLYSLPDKRPRALPEGFYLAGCVILAWLLRASTAGTSAFIYFQF